MLITTELINKLRGIDVVVFAGGLSGQLEGEEMPGIIPWVQKWRPNQY